MFFGVISTQSPQVLFISTQSPRVYLSPNAPADASAEASANASTDTPGKIKPLN